jgi:predicted DCC family thiol-disulfide oxidoreductase YuxK
MKNESPVLLFDGVCNLCNGTVQWIIERDPEGKIKFASLQSGVGRTLLQQHGLPVDQLNSVVLIDKGKVYLRSDATLQLLYLLGGWWAVLSLKLWVVPRFVLNAVYDYIARNRYRWFGKKDQCMMPSPALKARFLDN